MGREIVYCWKCAKRLDGAAFEKRQAYRVGDQVSCRDCVDELIADLPAEEQEAVLNAEPPSKGSTGRIKVAPSDTPTGKRRTGPVPVVRTGATTKATKIRTNTTGRLPAAAPERPTKTRSITRPMPKAAPPEEEEELAEEGAGDEAAAKKKKLLLMGAGGGGLLLVVVVAAFLYLRKPPEAPASASGPDRSGPAAPKVDPRKAREEAARKAYEAAMTVFRDSPADLGAQRKALDGARESVLGTSLEEEFARQVEIVDDKIQKEVSKLDEEAKPLLADNKFKAARDLYEAALARYDHDSWRGKLDAKVASIQGIVDDRFLNLRKEALRAKEAGELERMNAAVAKVAAFEMPELVAKLKKELEGETAAKDPDASAPAAKGDPKAPKKRVVKPLPPELKEYAPGFGRALGLMALRDFDAAAGELRRAAKDADNDTARDALKQDLEALELAKAYVDGSGKVLAGIKRLESLAVEVQERPAEFRILQGRVLSTNDQRAEMRVTEDRDGKKVQKVTGVEWVALSARTLHELTSRLKGNAAPKTDGLAAAYLSLTEGNDEAAEKLAGAEAKRIPDRWWAHAPEAKDRTPKGSREFEARALFHAAESEWRAYETWGPALEKYRTLQNDYAGTLLVRNNSALISSRSASGKDYTFHAKNLSKEGGFKTAAKGEPVVQSTKDVDISEARDNYVEATFYAMPKLTYRCWVYVGACCKETFTFYYQTTDGTISYQGKQAPLDPGGQMAAPVQLTLTGLKKDHAAHKPKDPKAPHPKEAARWEWLSVPLPKQYENAGPKSLRLLTDQSGFAVKFIVVSATRTYTPKEPDLAEFTRILNEAVENPDTSSVKGTPDPKEWLVCGPFAEALNTQQPPEREIDLAKEMKGKSGNVKWTTANAETGGGRARFDWDKNRTFPAKDNVSCYALIHVKAPAGRTASLQIGHDEGGRVWLNGQLVHSNNTSNFANDAFKSKIDLEEGWNRLLVKVRNATGGFGFVLRIVDEAGKPIEGLEFHPYGDQLVPP